MKSPNWLRDAAARLDAERVPSEAERAQAIAEAMPIPAGAADWAELRRAMLARMALAALRGHDAVRLSQKGYPIWVARSPGEDGQLSYTPRGAAREIAERLGDDRFVQHLARAEEAARYERRQELARIGEALFGPEWVAPTARLLEVDLRTAQRWASGTRGDAPSDAVLADLRRRAAAVAGNRRGQLRRWLATLDALDTEPG